MTEMGIYQIRNTVNGRRYIGATKNRIEARWSAHRRRLQSQKHLNTELQADWNTLGAEAFVWEVLEALPSPISLPERENYWMQQFPASDLYNERRRLDTRSDCMVVRNQSVVLAALEVSGRDLTARELVSPDLQRSSVYAALNALVRDGLVASEWDLSGKRPERRYHITGQGLIALEQERRRLSPHPPASPEP